MASAHRKVGYMHATLFSPDCWTLRYPCRSSRFSLKLFSENFLLNFYHVRPYSFSINNWVSAYTSKFTGSCSTASPILLYVVSLEETLLGVMVTVIVEEEFSTIVVPTGGKRHSWQENISFCKSTFKARLGRKHIDWWSRLRNFQDQVRETGCGNCALHSPNSQGCSLMLETMQCVVQPG